MTVKMVGRGDTAIAVEYLVALQELAFERGIEPRQFLAGSDLPVDIFIHDDIKIGNESLVQVLRNCPSLLADPMLPYDFARRLTLSRHGKLGFALNGCATVHEAITLLIQLIDIRIQNLKLKLEINGDIAEVFIVDQLANQDVLAPEQAQIEEIFVLTILCCLALMAKQLIGQLQSDRDIVIHTTYPSRGVDPRRQQPALDIQYQGERHSIFFPAALLEMQPTAHNPAISQAALAQCEEELLAMNARGITFTDQVRNLIYCDDRRHWRSIDEVADALFMSVSSLKRKLNQQGSSFQHIKNSERFSRAIQLLEDERMTLENISELLGYSNASNFSKAFKVWTGYSTKQYLNKHRG
ncbi:helix-turn-helix domain-containing protein [Spongiibacter sp.]|uniref:AraC family transcriptional regulator n=1 Tax=Spongiibacter sp. TaxID=2024860 RepID=UPI0035641A98